jgi:hypothetical protein
MVTWNGHGRKLPWSNFKILSQNVPRGTEENHAKPQDNRSLDRDLKPGPPEYEAGMLGTQPKRLFTKKSRAD